MSVSACALLLGNVTQNKDQEIFYIKGWLFFLDFSAAWGYHQQGYCSAGFSASLTSVSLHVFLSACLFPSN